VQPPVWGLAERDKRVGPAWVHEEAGHRVETLKLKWANRGEEGAKMVI